MDEAQIKLANVQPFDLHDLFPLIPGIYKLSILVKNEISKDFTTLEQTLVVPEESPTRQVTLPILGYRIARVDSSKTRLKPFQFGPTQIYCQPNRVFTKKEPLAVAFQILGLSPDERAEGVVQYTYLREDRVAYQKSRPLAEYADWPNCLEEFSLAEFAPAHYKIRIAALAQGKEIASQSEEFDLTPQAAIPRPWFYSKLMPEPGDPVYDHLIGTQLLNSGRAQEAKAYLEKAFQRRSDSPEIALSLAQAHMALAEYAKVEPVLVSFLKQTKSPKYEIFSLAGQAHQKLNEFAKAVEIYDQAVNHFGINANLLNAIGECYLGLGRTKEALAAWEKSLEISPDQPQIRKSVQSLKEKK